MRILITGGFGFVGGRLAVHLAQLGHQIILGTRHSIASPRWLPQAEVAKIVWDDEEALERSCDGVAVIIHAAGMNAQDCAVDPVGALEFNGLATARLVAAATRASVKKFIYLSTAHVYANPLVGTIAEETCPSNLHPYATSHLAGEYAVLSANQTGTIQGIVLRLSNVFGAPMHKDVNCWMLLVNDLCRQVVQRRRLMLRTGGLQQRDFIAITAVCNVIEKFAIDLEISNQTGIFNVGLGESKSVLAMAQLIQHRCSEVLGFDALLLCEDSRVDGHELKLSYKSDKLIKIKCDIDVNNEVEIDQLLIFCNTNFSYTSSSRIEVR